MKKIRKHKLELRRITLRQVSGANGPTNSDLWCTLLGRCESVPPMCPSNWITHCTINGDTGYTCIDRCGAGNAG